MMTPTKEAAIVAIVLGTLAGVLVAVFPSDVFPWVPVVAGGLTAIATVVDPRQGVDAAE